MLNHQTAQQLRALKLYGMADALEQQLAQPATYDLPFEERLGLLVDREVTFRDTKRLQRLLKAAKLRQPDACLENLDYRPKRELDKRKMAGLSTCDWIRARHNLLITGMTGTGKTHLATGLCVAAARQKRKVRFTTATGLINELVEAQHRQMLGRALQRWASFDLLAIDEIGYVPFAEVGAELLYQVISDRAEKAALIVTTNLPFSEWTQVFPNTRLCKAVLDRVTDRAHIIETGTESFRFRRTIERKEKKKR